MVGVVLFVSTACRAVALELQVPAGPDGGDRGEGDCVAARAGIEEARVQARSWRTEIRSKASTVG